MWHQNPDISLLLNLYREFKFEVRFDLEPLNSPKPQNSGFLDWGSQNLLFKGFITQVWHQNPDISLLSNLYLEFKFEVRFDLGPLKSPKPKNSGFFDRGSQNLFFEGFITQVWHQNPDISLLLNLYHEFKFEVRFDLESLNNTKLGVFFTKGPKICFLRVLSQDGPKICFSRVLSPFWPFWLFFLTFLTFLTSLSSRPFRGKTSPERHPRSLRGRWRFQRGVLVVFDIRDVPGIHQGSYVSIFRSLLSRKVV